MIPVFRNCVPACVFTVSGFSGLNLRIHLRATISSCSSGTPPIRRYWVLVIFMAAWQSARRLPPLFNALDPCSLAYAVVEGYTGVIRAGFHRRVRRITQFSFAHVIPQLHSAPAVHVYKWGLGAAHDPAPVDLLGMTFPLMSAGFVRLVPDAAGRSIPCSTAPTTMGMRRGGGVTRQCPHAAARIGTAQLAGVTAGNRGGCWPCSRGGLPSRSSMSIV